MKNIVLISISILFLFACKQDPSSDWEEVDLLKHGMPVTIKAPIDAEVKVQDLGIWKDVTIQKDKDFYIQIICSDATLIDIAQLKANKLKEVEDGKFFSKIVEEKEDGFIFEKKITDTRINYDFRRVKVVGDKEYTYQTGLIGLFTEDQVRAMYNAIQ